MSETDATNWQPIGTAPDDEEILVFTQEWGTIVALHSAEYGTWMSRMQVPVTIDETQVPTHWRPLPPAPDATAGG